MVDDNADAVLHYVIALEALLASESGDRSDLTRKTAQRAAMLCGDSDERRLEVEHIVRVAYDARSKYAHGDEPPAVDAADLRRVVRQSLLARLIIGDPASDGATTLAALADRALLSTAVRDKAVRAPIAAFEKATGHRM